MARRRQHHERSPGSPRSCGESASGLVIRLQSRHARVATEEGREIRCTMRKTLFRELGNFTKPIAVGDRVRITVFAENDAVVEEVLPRKTYLSRRQAETGKEQIMVANLDQVLITVALAEPAFRPRIIDRILVATERAGAEAVVALTKADLLDQAERAEAESIATLYRDLGYEVVFTSHVNGEGIDELRRTLVGKTTVLTGQSGVGKSTLLNTVQPGLDLAAKTVSDKWGKGRHTTTSTSLIPFDGGGYVIDTPGIRSWGIAGLEPSDIAIFFADLAPFVESCRFNECTHEHEPECAVKNAVVEGQVDERRYDSYLRIITGMEEDED